MKITGKDLYTFLLSIIMIGLISIFILFCGDDSPRIQSAEDNIVSTNNDSTSDIKIIESTSQTNSEENTESEHLGREEIEQMETEISQLEDKILEKESFPDEIEQSAEIDREILDTLDFDLESYLEILDVITLLCENNIDNPKEGSRLIDEYIQNNWIQVEYLHTQIGNLSVEEREPLLEILRRTKIFQKLLELTEVYADDPNINLIISYWIRYN